MALQNYDDLNKNHSYVICCLVKPFHEDSLVQFTLSVTKL